MERIVTQMSNKCFITLILCLYLSNFKAENIDLNLDFKDINFEFYTQLQFPQCYTNSLKADVDFEDDYSGIIPELINLQDHKTLERNSKILRDYQRKVIKLKQQNKLEELLQTGQEVISFINDSYIFDINFLTRYDPKITGFYSLRGYRIDMLSALQFTTLSIVNAYYEAAKELNNEDLIYQWAKTGFEINRWINNRRGCLNFIDDRYSHSKTNKKGTNPKPICNLNSLTESKFSEQMALHYMNKGDYSESIQLASLSLTSVQLTPESQIAFKSAAIQRLNNLARLAYSANQKENWCLSYEGFDRTIRLSKELNIQSLEVWKDLKQRASEYYIPIESNLWTEKYGMASKEVRPYYFPIKQIPPEYPRSLLDRGVEGCVMLRFGITKEGQPINIEVDWSTDKRFDRSAKRLAKNYVFSPPYKAGVPSEVQEAKTMIVYKLASKTKGPGYIPAGCE